MVGEYVDNSIGASDAGKNRPGYDALMRAYEASEFDALICYDTDRLTRQMEDWVYAAEKRGLDLVTANCECDLQTDAGLTFARVRTAFALGEVKRKSARQRAAAVQRAEGGRPPRGRLTGYTPKGEAVPDEAELVRPTRPRYEPRWQRGVRDWPTSGATTQMAPPTAGSSARPRRRSRSNRPRKPVCLAYAPVCCEPDQGGKWSTSTVRCLIGLMLRY